MGFECVCVFVCVHEDVCETLGSLVDLRESCDFPFDLFVCVSEGGREVGEWREDEGVSGFCSCCCWWEMESF